MRAFSATGDGGAAVEQDGAFGTPSTMKQVLKRPPEPNASPQPITVSRIAQALALGRAETSACQRFTLASVLGHRELRRLHEIDRQSCR